MISGIALVKSLSKVGAIFAKSLNGVSLSAEL